MQFTQAAIEVADVVDRKVPGGHGVGSEVPISQKDPAGHGPKLGGELAGVAEIAKVLQ